MTHLKKLKTETLLKMLPIIVLLAFFGILFLSISNTFVAEPEAVYLHDVPRNELEGAYVTVNLDYIYGCYAYTETYEDNKPTGKITQREYLIDANPEDYMCVILSGDLMDKAEILLKQSDEYYYGERDDITASFVITGLVKTLPSDSKEFLYDAVDYYSLSAEEKAIYLPLYIDVDAYEKDPVFMVIGGVLLAIAVVMLVMVLSGHYQRQVKERLLQYFGTYADKANEFMNYMVNLPSVKGLRIGAGYMLVRAGYHHFLYDGNDVVWAYQQTTRQRLYGVIPLGKTYTLMLGLSDGKFKTVPMSEAKVKEQLQLIARNFPTVAVGYSEQLRSLYNSNREALRQVAAAQRSQQ